MNKNIIASYAQFFAAIFIVFRHYSFFMPDGAWKDYFIRVNYVELFFLFSGFFLFTSSSAKALTWSSFLLRRFARIYPAHLVTTIFFLSILLLRKLGAISGAEGNVYDLYDLPFVLTLTHSFGFTGGHSYNYPTWYLSAQFFMYLAFVPVMALFRTYPVRTLMLLGVIVVGSVVLLEVFSLSASTHWLNWTFDFGVLRGVPSFFCGVLVGWLSLKYRKPLWSWQVPLLVFIFTALSFGIESNDFYIYFINQLLLLVAIVFTSPVSQGRFFSRAFFNVDISDLAFGVYMFHVPVAAVVLSFFYKKFFIVYGVSSFIGLSLFISVLVSIVWFKYFSLYFQRLFLIYSIR